MSTPKPRAPRGDSLHQQVARNIRNKIESGKLRDGESLPSTREMAAEWDVSVFTINEAMRVLADEGLVVSKSRSKRVVRAPEGSPSTRRKPERPHVFFVGGYPGSGKSELSRILARETGWAMLDKDTLTRPVVEAALELMGHSPHDRESEQYVSKIRPREYESLISTTIENAECGVSSVATAPFIREFADAAWLDRTRASLDALNVTTTFVWIYCDGATMHSYMRQRGAARDAFKLADWPGWLSTLDLEFRPPVEHHVIDNSASSTPLQVQARALIDQVVAAAV